MENKKNPGSPSVREEDMFYEYWLASLKPLSARKKRMLRDAYGSARAVYYIEETRLDQEIYLTGTAESCRPGVTAGTRKSICGGSKKAGKNCRKAGSG